jgi:hypothetical protein
MYRLYWWVRGADPTRHGGAWWVDDFHYATRGDNHLLSPRMIREDFLAAIRSTLYAYALTDGSEGRIDPLNVCPPAEAKIIYPAPPVRTSYPVR